MNACQRCGVCTMHPHILRVFMSVATQFNVLTLLFASQACTPGKFRVSGPLLSISMLLGTKYCVPHPNTREPIYCCAWS